MKLPGINIQAPWAELIIAGKKTVETRLYPLPQKYVGKRMAMIETPGRDGRFSSRLVGVVVFGESFSYRSRKQFYADSGRHHVFPDSDFSWDAGNGRSKWGWPIVSVERVRKTLPPGFRKGIVFSRHVPVGL
jgi:hypothetical protein